MAKNSIRDYDATSGNNTDVQSIDISEGCAASGINNAIRELMADIKDVSTGAVNLETPAADRLDVDNIRIDGNTISSTDTNGNITLDPNGTGDTIVASGNVGIGSAPDTISNGKSLQVNRTVINDDDGGSFHISQNGYYNSAWKYVENGTAEKITFGSGAITFDRATSNSGGADAALSWSESMRLTDSGALFVGKTARSFGTAGIDLQPAGDSHFTASSQPVASFNRLTTNGEIVAFYKDSTLVGRIMGRSGVVSTLILDPRGNGIGLTGTSHAFFPTDESGNSSDNVKDVGTSGNRFDDIHATNGTIQTSDENEKQQIASLTDAEITAAKALSKLFKTFKWNSAVTAKGDDARTHTGVIAQQVQTAMTDAGLDADDYAFFIRGNWWEADETYTDDDGVEQTRTNTYYTADEAPEGATERTRLGIRYPELLAFIGAATEQRLADIETRLTALEDA